MKKNSLHELGWTLIIMAMPILYGIWVYQELPENVAAHFAVSGEGNLFLPKFLVVFVLPLIMLALQAIIFWSTITKDILNTRFKHIIRWAIPFVFVPIYVSTLYKGLDVDFDIRKLTTILVGLVLIVVGNYLPKKVQADKRPLNRKWAYLFLLFGLIFIVVSLFML